MNEIICGRLGVYLQVCMGPSPPPAVPTHSGKLFPLWRLQGPYL